MDEIVSGRYFSVTVDDGAHDLSHVEQTTFIDEIEYKYGNAANISGKYNRAHQHILSETLCLFSTCVSFIEFMWLRLCGMLCGINSFVSNGSNSLYYILHFA